MNDCLKSLIFYLLDNTDPDFDSYTLTVHLVSFLHNPITILSSNSDYSSTQTSIPTPSPASKPSLLKPHEFTGRTRRQLTGL
jgi:hypothetical protein